MRGLKPTPARRSVRHLEEEFMKDCLCQFGVAAVFLFLAACGRTTTANVERPIIAPVVKAAPANLSREVVLTAEFKPYQEVDVHAKVAGYVKKIYVDIGDRVRAGQLLAELEIPEAADEVLRAGASTRLSAANVARAREELLRAESAHQASHLSY